MNKFYNKSHKGFSLIESLVVIAVVSILLSISFGGIYMIRRAQVNGATQQIVTQLKRAKGYATSYDKSSVRICFKNDDKGTLCASIQYATDEGYVEKYSQSVGKGIKVSFKDSNGWNNPLGNVPLYIYFDKRSGRVTKVTSDFGALGEREWTDETSVYGVFSIWNSRGNTTKVGSVKLYYENGTVD